jgi:hypothetical protein
MNDRIFRKKYVRFELVERKPKTKVYYVVTNKDDAEIGTIKWLGGWRQYCFFPGNGTVWSRGCLRDIIEFIDYLMEEQQIQRRKEKDEC